jgi:MFS transporter, UMF1 family
MNNEKKQKWSWIFYDFANSAFATTVLAGFFPVFFKKFWSAGADSQVTTSRLGLALGTTGILMAVLSPIWGRKSDLASSRKKWLVGFALIGIVFTALLSFVPQGQWPWALLVYVLCYIAFEGSVVFYDSLLMEVAPKKDFEKVSSLGYAFGYLGGGLLFTLNVLMTLYPHHFGLKSATEAVQFSFLSVAIWWFVFTLPLVFFLKEKPHPLAHELQKKESVLVVFEQLLQSFKKLHKQKPIFYFLLSYWFYIDGVFTVYTMAVDFGLSIGLKDTDLMKALLLTQFVGFPSALLFGKLSEKFHVKTLLLLCLAVYSLVLIFSTQLKTGTDFMILAVCVGLVQGALQALSRSFYAHLIPENQKAEYFGFFNIIGKSASFVGPFLVAIVTLMTGNHRLSLFSIVLLFALGAYFLLKTDMKKEQVG